MNRIVILLMAVCCALGRPMEDLEDKPLGSPNLQDAAFTSEPNEKHNIAKRFINPMFNLDSVPDTYMPRIRAKRSNGEEECEKLRLCKLHSRSSHNFLAAYKLYFVSKENARLWDHRARSVAECERRYGDCYRR